MDSAATIDGEIVDLLASSATHGRDGAPVVRRETHGAFVFLAGRYAWKIKRPVRFAYMDFSTPALRRAALSRELEFNRRFAPDIYLDLVPVTRGPDGRVRLGGVGRALEWVLKMRRFDEADLLGNRLRQGPLAGDTAKALADVVVASHAQAVRHPGAGASLRLEATLGNLVAGLREVAGLLGAERIEHLADLARGRWRGVVPVLEARGEAGFVRRCHGDLHANNIVIWQGRPTLFDALEFDEDLATVDTLYDLAFLIMDLDHNGQREAANVVLNRYLWRHDALLDLAGLAALPLMLALRAAIRALVSAQHVLQSEKPSLASGPAVGERVEAGRYLEAAIAYLEPAGPRLVAVGGLSGTGKSTLAARLAPGIGAAPGAVHLRSDLERKAMLGAGETERLGPAGYTDDVSEAVYRRLVGKARAALEAGHAVVVDAVFDRSAERRAIAAVAEALGVPFDGLWLTAPADVLMSRVAGRTGDASDADQGVVARQLDRDCGAIKWAEVDASGDVEATIRRARHQLDPAPD